jgi:hypothetical protein
MRMQQVGECMLEAFKLFGYYRSLIYTNAVRCADAKAISGGIDYDVFTHYTYPHFLLLYQRADAKAISGGCSFGRKAIT